MRYLKAVAALGLLLTVTATAGANTVKGTLTGYPGEWMDVSFDGHTDHTVAGVYVIDKISSSGLGDNLADPFDVVCVDLYGTIYSGRQYDWAVKEDLADVPTGSGQTGMGDTRAQHIEELFYLHWNDAIGGGNAKKAALGASVWEIVYEPEWDGSSTKPWDLDSDNLQISRLSTTAHDTAETWLAGLTGVPVEGTTVYGLDSDDTQDFGVAIPNGGGYIPEPVTMAGLALGIGALGGYVRRRKG